MLTKAVNEQITRVGPGTPMGTLLRNYWFPVAAAVELDENPVKKVRLLGEDLVLYRDRSGTLGLIDEPCPHRRVSMEYGIPEDTGLRCPYHGWLFDHEGRCLEQPSEPWNSTFKDRVRTKAYKVETLGGLVFAYLGPEPAPLLPRYDLFVMDNVVRQIGVTVLPCNWVQCMENSLDPTHAEWLHGHYMQYLFSRKGVQVPNPLEGKRHTRLGFDVFEHGIVTRRLVEGVTEKDVVWQAGASVVFPNYRRVGTTFQIRVPIDDENTLHYNYAVYRPNIPLPPQDSVPLYEIPLTRADGSIDVETFVVQDFMAWVTQGRITDRSLEHLGQADVGIILYRDLLREQIAHAERGEDSMEVYRDPATCRHIELPETNVPGQRARMFHGAQGLPNGAASDFEYSPLRDQLLDLQRRAQEWQAAGKPLLPFRDYPAYTTLQEKRRVVQLMRE